MTIALIELPDDRQAEGLARRGAANASGAEGFLPSLHRLGFGFLEHVYVKALEIELRRLGLRVAREVLVRVYYDGEYLCRYRIDMVVNEKLVVEVKSTYEPRRGAPRQLLNELRATTLEVGLLLHFGPEPKFYRLHAPNSQKKHHQQSD